MGYIRGLGFTTPYAGFLAFLISDFAIVRYQKDKKPCGRDWGRVITGLYIYTYIHIYKLYTDMYIHIQTDH